MDVKLKAWLILALLLGTAVYALAEEITLTTYYPSPRGVYQELKTAGDMVIGDITNPPGARLHVVQEGTAPALRVDDVPFALGVYDPSPFLIDQAGNVGIGTAGPGAKLDIAGTLKIVDGTEGAGKVLMSNAAGLASWQVPPGFSDMVVFATSQTFTVPVDVAMIWVRVWGGGGGGAGYTGSPGGGGGGGGGYAEGLFTVTPGAPFSVTVGGGGAGGAGVGLPGDAGSASSFGSLISGSGGAGGLGGQGGLGGSGSGGQFAIAGGRGTNGLHNAGGAITGGTGGAAGAGGAGGPGVSGVGLGGSGRFPGGGGGGGYSSTPGQAGAGGAVVVVY